MWKKKTGAKKSMAAPLIAMMRWSEITMQ